MSSLFGAPGPYDRDRKISPSICENASPHRPVLCYYCNKAPAVQLLGVGVYDRLKVFCCVGHAALCALQDFSLTSTKQCDFCGGWTDEAGICDTCDTRVTVAEQNEVLQEIENALVMEANTHEQD